MEDQKNIVAVPQASALPAQAVPLERGVLSACLIDTEAITKLWDNLSSEVFYLDKHKAIYRSMIRLFETSHPIDLFTVMNDLKKNGELDLVGGPAYLAEISSIVTSSANVEYHARILVEKYILRQIAKAGNKVYYEASKDKVDALDLVDALDATVVGIRQMVNGSMTTNSIGNAAAKVLDDITWMTVGAGKDADEVGAKWFSYKLNSVLGPMKPGDNIVVTGATGDGKTLFADAVAEGVCEYDESADVIWFSLEVPDSQLSARRLFRLARLNTRLARRAKKIKPYQLPWLREAASRMHGERTIIVNAAGFTMADIRAKVREQKMKSRQAGRHLALAIIDYVQIVTPSDKKGNRESQVAGISMDCKRLAMSEDIPVMGMAQTNEDKKARQDKRPHLGDIRESKAIAQNADTVIMLNRPANQNQSLYKADRDNDNRLEAIVRKSRHGENNKLILLYTKIEWGQLYDSDDDLGDEEKSIDERDKKALTEWKETQETKELPF